MKNEPNSLLQRIVERCSASGLVCLVLNDGRVRPASPVHVGPWTSRLCEAITLIRDIDGVREVLPGAFAVRCPGTQDVPTIWIVALGRTSPATPTAPGIDAGVARFDEEGARAALTLCAASVNDLSAIAEHEQTIEGFTSQLSQAFDTIDCLYMLGRAMQNPARPREFLRFVCERLKLSSDFAWVAARFEADEHHATSLTDGFYLSGEPGVELGEFLRLSGEVAHDAAKAKSAEILPYVRGLSPSPSSQVLTHPIRRGVSPRGALIAGGKGGPDPAVSSWDIQLIEAAAGFIGSFLENVALYEEQRTLFMGTLQALTAAIDAKDRYTCGHSERVAHVSAMLAAQVGLDEAQVERIRIAGLVHDVGKIGVPEAVLTKQGRLTDLEFDAIKRHPQIGYGILRDIPQLADVLPGVLHHHERWDGRGYPTGLSNTTIPLQARIIAIADTFDAMSSTRSYRPAMPRTKVLEELRRCSGSQFDPALIPGFLKLDLSAYDQMVARHAVGEQALAAAPADQAKAA